MKNRFMLLFTMLATQMAGMPNVDAVDMISCPVEHKVLLLNDLSHEGSWGAYGSSIALKQQIAHLGFNLKALTPKCIDKVNSIPEDLAAFKDPTEFELFKQDNPSLMKAIEKADVVIINGADDMTGLSDVKLLYIAYISKVFLMKHVEILNHSCYPQGSLEIDNVAACKLYHHVYEQLDFIAIREILSSQLMRILHIENRLSFDMLPLYIRDHYTPIAQNCERNIVVGACCNWSENGLNDLTSYLNEMSIDNYHIKVLLSSKLSPTESEIKLINHLESYAPFEWKLEVASHMKQWVAHIDNASLVISGKFHDIIAALHLRTPFITLDSDTPKIQALLKMTTQFKPLKMDDSLLQTKLLAKTSYLLDCPFEELGFASREKIENLAENNLCRIRKASPTLNAPQGNTQDTYHLS